MPLIPPKLRIKSQPIERAVSIRFFGFLLDEHLSWKKHDKYIENKVSKCIDLLYKESSLPALYYSYFHSIVMSWWWAEGIGEGVVDGFPFLTQASSSEAATSSILIFWA